MDWVISSQAAAKAVEGSTTTVSNLKTQIDVDAVREMAKTMSGRSIAKAFGMSHRTMARRLREWGIETPSWRKLPSNDEVIALYKAGNSLEKIQAQYGGCPKRILQICGVARRPQRRVDFTMTDEQKAKLSAFRRGNFLGERNPNWRGGKQPPDQRERASYGSKEWSKAVRARDNHTCQHCGETQGRLHAHHIKSWKRAPELRFDVSNGITLCQPCHIKVHNFKFPWVHGETARAQATER